MKIGDWLGRRTWLGLAVSLLIWAGMGLLGAGLMLKGLVPEMTGEWLAVSWAAASFTGGLVALKGKQKRLLRAAMQSVLLYSLLWAMAFSIQTELSFGVHGVQITAAVFGGGLAAALFPDNGRKKVHAGTRGRSGHCMANSTKTGKRGR